MTDNAGKCVDHIHPWMYKQSQKYQHQGRETHTFVPSQRKAETGVTYTLMITPFTSCLGATQPAGGQGMYGRMR